MAELSLPGILFFALLLGMGGGFMVQAGHQLRPRWRAGILLAALALLSASAWLSLPAPTLAQPEPGARPKKNASFTQAGPSTFDEFGIQPTARVAAVEPRLLEDFPTPMLEAAPAPLEETIPPPLSMLPTSDPTPELDLSDIQGLIIPDLGVDAVVIFARIKGDTWDLTGLRERVAWLEGTARPGEGGNTVLAAHITVLQLGNGPFRYLHHLRPGDRIEVITQERIYTYKVRAQQVVQETDVHITALTAKPQLTLLTCTGWDEQSERYRYRRAVFADLLRSSPLSERTRYKDFH